jgi:hypothetical protein
MSAWNILWFSFQEIEEKQNILARQTRFVKVESEQSERTLTNLLGGYGIIFLYHIRPWN